MASKIVRHHSLRISSVILMSILLKESDED
jgi:hypothetical protein